MNVLFLTLAEFNSIEEKRHALYTDLLELFRKDGHQVYAISPISSSNGKDTYIVREENTQILRLKTGDVQKTNIIKKGINTLTIETVFKNAIKKYFSGVKFDWVLYSTPPITFYKAIAYVKKRDNAKTYLLLKDIFPQNSVDLGLLSKSGPKGSIYRYFRRKEKLLYDISDRIGCMSEANVRYVLAHNKNVTPDKIEVCPNSVSPRDMSASPEQRKSLRKKYNLPLDKKIFVYGGNLGKPQGVDFIIECLQKQCFDDAYFLIVGSGTEFDKLKSFADTAGKTNVRVMSFIPKEDYDNLVGSCDAGMIFLDYRFTIPNFPSRLLSYMQAKLPVICATDPNTDIGTIAEQNGFGVRCLSNDADGFINGVAKLLNADMQKMGEQGFRCLNEMFAVGKAYGKILGSMVR